MPATNKRSTMAAALRKASLAWRKSPAMPSSISQANTLPGSVDEISATYSNAAGVPAMESRILSTMAALDNPDTSTLVTPPRRVSTPKFFKFVSSCSEIAVEHLVTKLAAQTERFLVRLRERTAKVPRHLCLDVFELLYVSIFL